MKKIFAILLSALALGGCENDGIPYVSLGLDDLYKVARMQTCLLYTSPSPRDS